MTDQKNKSTSVLDRPLSRPKGDIPLSTFAYLFSEIVQYHHKQVDNITDLEAGLHRAGYGIGQRYLELISIRDSKPSRRDQTPIMVMQYIHTQVWRALFGRPAAGLERNTDDDHEFYLIETDAATNRFISVPREMEGLNCAAFIAGIINGILDSQGMPAEVVVTNRSDDQTVFVVKLL